MKELNDYLHLYLGCEVGVKDRTGCMHIYKLIGLKPKFDGYLKKVVNQILLEDIKKENVLLSETTSSGWEWPHQAKLILRPLSDMTEEEGNKRDLIWSKNSKAENFYEETRFFLSKHFDLFGLIPAGLAIDKTKLKITHDRKRKD